MKTNMHIAGPVVLWMWRCNWCKLFHGILIIVCTSYPFIVLNFSSLTQLSAGVPPQLELIIPIGIFNSFWIFFAKKYAVALKYLLFFGLLFNHEPFAVLILDSRNSHVRGGYRRRRRIRCRNDNIGATFRLVVIVNARCRHKSHIFL